MKPISDLEIFLGNMGLKCVHREAPVNAMGYKLIEYAGADLRIRLVWEKGFWDFKITDTILSPEVWYDIRLFTYLFDGPAQPEMPFEDQVEYARHNWSKIIDALGPGRRVQTRIKLDAAKKERARKMYMIWPSAIRDLEFFLKKHGLACTCRKEARFLYDSMTLRYADSKIAIQMDSRHGWRVHFADMSCEPDRWFCFDSIRRLVQWPEDKKLTYAEAFEFIKTNWQKIVGLFAPEKSKETYERLHMIEV
jgi:hypothetical protein